MVLEVGALEDEVVGIVDLGELAAAVLSADYRGDRPQLARLEAKLGGIDAGALNDYRDYWRGFALWRRLPGQAWRFEALPPDGRILRPSPGEVLVLSAINAIGDEGPRASFVA